MRLTPLPQEVRRTTFKVPDEEQIRRDYTRWLILIALYVVTVLLTAPFYLYKPPAGRENTRLEQAPIHAWTDFRFESEEARQEFEQERRQSHRRVYVYKPDVRDEVLADLQGIFQTVDALSPGKDEPSEMIEVLRREDSRLAFLTESEVTEFVENLKDPRFRQSLRSMVLDAYSRHVIVEQATMYKGFLKNRVVDVRDPHHALANRRDVLEDPLPYPPDLYTWNELLRRLNETFDRQRRTEVRRVAEALLSALLRPNLLYNEEASREAYENYPERDLTTMYSKDEVLVPSEAADRTLDPEEARLLQVHRDAVEKRHNIRLMGHAAFVFIVFLILSFYVRRFSREFEFTTYNIMLVSIPVLMALALEAVFIFLADGETARVGYLFPAGALGMLGVLLLEVRMALLLVTWGCLLMGLQVDLNYQLVVVGIFGGYTAVAALATIRKRWDVFLASILIGIVNAAVILISGFIANREQIPLDMAGLGFFGGIGSFLVLAVLPVFERFGIITDMQLLELTGLQHPLLRRIEEEAPGTWQHTLNVTKLAEAAAQQIGVNYLLVRAGCYYHDIGKVKKPEYFTENQITNEDKMRHAALKPIMSTLIIKNHVKEGVEMARAAKLPQRIIDFITQHHGTSLIAFFYSKALDTQERGESKEPVREEEYRYPGPKPQTIEAAIVMLADSVEATATAKLSTREVRMDDIQQVVRNTIFDKFNDGQFNECNLTLRDLNVIRQTFVKVLKSRFHTRIDYPKREKGGQKDKKEKPKDRGSDSRTSTDTRSQAPLSEKQSAVLRES